MHQPLQGARRPAPYNQDAARRGRDAYTIDARDCTCGHGPVISEAATGEKVRVVCCYCGRKTTARVSVTSALAAWNAGKAKI